MSAPPDTAGAVTAAHVDNYETAVRFVTEVQRLLARMAPEPAGSLVIAWADLARDVTAIQLSAIRWWLEL